MKKRSHVTPCIRHFTKEGKTECIKTAEDSEDATAKEKALTAILRKLAYEDFSALEKAALNEDDTCCCESCKERRAWTNDTLEELKLIQSYWLELRQYLRIIYRLGMKGSIKSIDEDYHTYMKELVSRLCEVCNPHQLYQRLEAQVREFVIEMKMRLLQLMDKLADNPQLPRLFISGMLDRYHKMMSAAQEITPVLLQLESEHLSKFNLTWKMLNQRLFQTSIYTDPFFQNSVPLFITQLGKGNDSNENKMLVRDFLSFDDEITLIEGMWKDVEARINQYTQDHAMMARQRFLKEEYLNDLKALRRVRLKNCNNNKISNHGGKENRRDDIGIDEVENELSLNTTDVCECHVCLDTTPHTSHGRTLNRQKPLTPLKQDCQENKESSQQRTRPVKEVAGESIHHPHACLKHSDTIKRIPCPEQDEDSSPYNNHEDTHSDGSQADPRHCDCCYCEVFGHGIPTTAPMSRNYQEMRERLRLLLNKKKSKCKSNSGSPQPVNQATQKKQQSQHQGEGIKSQETRDTRDLEDLLVYIEGTEVKCRNEKRAAKKARQREKKQILLNRQKREEEEKRRLQESLEAKRREESLLRAAQEQKESEIKARKKGKGKGQANSNNKSQNKQQQNPQNSKESPVQASSPGPQMVTIKRVMEPHNSEPTVTITLRGATPNQDKVLYTLLNGQVCKVKDTPISKPIVSKNLKPSTNDTKASKGQSLCPERNIKSQQSSKKKQKDPKVPNGISISKVPTLPNEQLQLSPEIKITKTMNSSPTFSKPFNIEDIKLPPGITITKVDPSKVQKKNLIQDRQSSKLPSSTSSRSPPTSEVIVVSTGKLKEASQLTPSKEPNTSHNVSTGGSGKKKKTVKKSDQTNEAPSATVVPNICPTGKKKKCNKKKPDQNTKVLSGRTTMYPGIDIEPIDIPFLTEKEALSKPSVSISPSVFPEMSNKMATISTQILEQGKKKKKKNKKSSLTSSEELSLLDSVFAPKDIDLDDGEMDDAERELEAFKRFCFQSVPPKQKEKVHLNLKDIVLKKKSSAISCS